MSIQHIQDMCTLYENPDTNKIIHVSVLNAPKRKNCPPSLERHKRAPNGGYNMYDASQSLILNTDNQVGVPFMRISY